MLLIGGWCRCGLGMRGGDVGACRSSLLIDRLASRLRCGGSIASFGQPWLKFKLIPGTARGTCAFKA